jgi:hypothetical protein
MLAAALLLGCLPPLLAGQPAEVRLLPSQTHVGLAKVKLLVSDLAFEDDGMVGTYEIRIPLAPWRNDRGEVRFALNEPLEQVLASGGTVNGSGLSLENGRVHPITCRFTADGTVEITVRTHERTLAFKTRVEPKTAGSL